MRSYRNTLPLPLQFCDSWMVLKEIPDRKKKKRKRERPVSSAVINEIAKGVVMAEDRCLLTEYGGHLAFSDQQARNILNEIIRTEKKMVRKIATSSKVPVAPGLFKEEKFTFYISFTLGRLNAVILKVSQFQVDLTCHTQKAIGATKPCTAQKMKFSIKDFAENCGFGHIYWRNP